MAFLGALAALPALALGAQQPAGPVRAGESARRIAELRLVEDGRGSTPDAMRRLQDALAAEDTAVRRVAAEGLGRQESPQYVKDLLPLLHDSSAVVRATVANALAQSLRGRSARIAGDSGASLRRARDTVLAAFAARVREERSPHVLSSMARSAGRLPFEDTLAARPAEALIARIREGGARMPSRDRVTIAEGVAHGLYALARARRLGGGPSGSVDWLRGATVFEPGAQAGFGVEDREAAARVRRLAWLALGAARVRDVAHVSGGARAARRSGIRDPDPQVRRLALAYAPNVSDAAVRREVSDVARRDSSFMVRLEWARLFHALTQGRDCRPLLAALEDRNPHARLAAVDALGNDCPARDSVSTRLGELIARGPAAAGPRPAGALSWHARAHALVSLAKRDTALARPLAVRDASHPVWQVRMYAARAAALTHDTALLARLATDSVGNVREAAINGLSATAGHASLGVYLRALESPYDQVVLAAAKALRGAPPHRGAMVALLEALDRISASRRETSRDVRLELLTRIGELQATVSVGQRVRPYLADFDIEVAIAAGALLRRWSLSVPWIGAARSAAAVPRGLDEVVASDPVRLRVTMSPQTGGGSFVLRLRPGVAPATVARVLALVRSGYYDGLTWHRVEPNFVLQGGSPAMNEYVGDGPFMRDELSLDSHLRGTLGISTRGRDTGDAQWFVNLVDNYRLDHDYTVWAVVEAGMDVVDGILEGDVMQKVEIVRSGRR